MSTSPSPPSPLFERNLVRLREAARLGPVVDLACGRGRHALAAARCGLPVVGVDRNEGFLRALRAAAGEQAAALSVCRADLEAASGPPLRPESCGALLVFRFLWRPLAPAIERALVPGGLLLYETFTKAQASLENGPSNPEFLLEKKELRSMFPGLEVLGYEEIETIEGARGEACARLVARKPSR